MWPKSDSVAWIVGADDEQFDLFGPDLRELLAEVEQLRTELAAVRTTITGLREQVAALEDQLRIAEASQPRPAEPISFSTSTNPSWIPIQTDRPCVCGHDASVHEFFAPTGPCLDCECWAYSPAVVRTGIACPTGEHRLGTVCTHPTEGEHQ